MLCACGGIRARITWMSPMAQPPRCSADTCQAGVHPLYQKRIIVILTPASGRLYNVYGLYYDEKPHHFLLIFIQSIAVSIHSPHTYIFKFF